MRVEHHGTRHVAHGNAPAGRRLAFCYAVVDDEPPLWDADWRSAGTDLRRLPRLLWPCHLAMVIEPGERTNVCHDGISRNERNPDALARIDHAGRQRQAHG